MKNFQVTFVCTGNTCRSPMAEMILKKLAKEKGLANIKIRSAGTDAFDGDDMNEYAITALKNNHIPRTVFKSKRLSVDLINSSNLTITMTNGQKQLLSMFPNVYSFGEITGNEIPDPYGESAAAYDKTCRELINKMSKVFGFIEAEYHAFGGK